MSELPKEPFDPKLRAAMGEMLEIARKYDCAAHIALGSRQHMETRFRFPNWSVLKYEEVNGRPALRFRAKSGIHDPQDVAHTRNVLHGIFEDAVAIAAGLGPMIEMIDDAIGGSVESSEPIPPPPWDFR